MEGARVPCRAVNAAFLPTTLKKMRGRTTVRGECMGRKNWGLPRVGGRGFLCFANIPRSIVWLLTMWMDLEPKGGVVPCEGASLHDDFRSGMFWGLTGSTFLLRRTGGNSSVPASCSVGMRQPGKKQRYIGERQYSAHCLPLLVVSFRMCQAISQAR